MLSQIVLLTVQIDSTLSNYASYDPVFFSLSAETYAKLRRESLTDAVPSTPVDVTSSPAIQKTFFAKPRHKNKTHKLPGEQD